MILALALAGIGLVGVIGGLAVEFTEIGARLAEFVGGRPHTPTHGGETR